MAIVRELKNQNLKAGSHKPNGEYCLMEAVAWAAGEEWSDHPQTACPILSSFARRLNDARWSSDVARTAALLPFVELLIGSRRDKAVESRRRYFFADRAVRFFAPIALRARGFETEAAKLGALEPIRDAATAAYAADARDNVLRMAADVLRQAIAIGAES